MPHDTSVPLASVLCTEELDIRPSRAPDFEVENRALIDLVQALGDSPQTILQTLADKILEILDCGSAGVSLLTTHDGGKRFYWPAIAGNWRAHIGGGTPRDFGPCGDVLDCNSPLLFKHIERRYTYFQPVTPLVEEALLVPFYVENKAVGTIWAVAHDPDRKFDAEDQRRLLSLGRFASAAYQAVNSSDASKHLVAIVECSDDAIISKNLDGLITSWNSSAERLFGYTAEEAIGKHITLIVPPDRRDEETIILGKLRRGERVDHFETVRQNKDGARLDISLTISPVKDSTGRVIGASKVARDISDRKQMEAKLKAANDQLEQRVTERTSELQKKNEELGNQTHVVRDLSARLLQLQDEERRRIARELHDSVGQLLAAININISKVAREKGKLSPAAEKGVEENASMVEQVLTEIRTLSHLLHPPMLDEVGLESAIKWFIEGFAERSKIDVNLQLKSGLDRLPSDLELAIFRIIQECLTNIHRHSGSPTASIRLEMKDGSVDIEISDEGKGIPLEKQLALNSSGSLGVGFRGMRERVRQLAGTLEVHSNERGTTVAVSLPVRDEKKAATVGSVQ